MANPIYDLLVANPSAFVAPIYKRGFPSSPWTTLINRETWPLGVADTINLLTTERQAPTANPTWTDMITIVDGADAGLCIPTAAQIGFGETYRPLTLSRMALESRRFCAENSRNTWELREQLAAVINTLVDYVKIVWQMKHRTDYYTSCRHKCALLSTGLDDAWTSAADIAAAYPSDSASTHSLLTLGALDRIKEQAIWDGATDSALGKEDNMPIFTIICSFETREHILTLNHARRDDIRWGAPNLLLAPFGVSGSYKGYYFLCDPFPRRFNADGVGGYTEVLPWSSVAVWTNQAKTNHTKVELNANYLTAAFEETLWFDPSVYTEMVPGAIPQYDKFNWAPQDYVGNWSPRNILSEDKNPDGNLVYMRGILGSGRKYVHPERGWAIIHKRCYPALNPETVCPTTVT